MIRFCPNCGKKIEPGSKFCGSCGNALPEQNNSTINNSKKDIVLGQSKKRNYKTFITSFYMLVIAGGLIYYFATTKTKEEIVISEQPVVYSGIEYPSTPFDMQPVEAKLVNGKIVLPLNEVLDKKFVRFVYKSSTAEVPLLAYINEDGKLVTSISMCEPCESTTFHISGSELICNSCGSTWDLNDLDAISGSCGKYPPDPIPSMVKGNEIQIDEAVVLSWKRRV